MMMPQSDNTSLAVVSTKRNLSRLANAERQEFLFDCAVATSVGQQSLSDSLGGKPSGLGVKHKSATGKRPQHTDLHAHM